MISREGNGTPQMVLLNPGSAWAGPAGDGVVDELRGGVGLPGGDCCKSSSWDALTSIRSSGEFFAHLIGSSRRHLTPNPMILSTKSDEMHVTRKDRIALKRGLAKTAGRIQPGILLAQSGQASWAGQPQATPGLRCPACGPR